MFGFDDRTRALLRAVEARGSMAAAARAVGLDANNAARHLRLAGQRAGAPLVVARRGGAGGGGARLTAAGEALARAGAPATWSGRVMSHEARDGVSRVLVGAREVVAAGRWPLGPALLSLREEDVLVERPPAPHERVARTSVRNAWDARVEALTQVREGVWRVALLSGALKLAALVTAGARRDLRLREGSRVVARFKATALRVEPLESGRRGGP